MGDMYPFLCFTHSHTCKLVCACYFLILYSALTQDSIYSLTFASTTQMDCFVMVIVIVQCTSYLHVKESSDHCSVIILFDFSSVFAAVINPFLRCPPCWCPPIKDHQNMPVVEQVGLLDTCCEKGDRIPQGTVGHLNKSMLGSPCSRLC